MKIHPLLVDPEAVFVYRTPLESAPDFNDFRRAAFQALQAMGVEPETDKAVIKPNVTSGERFADPNTGITTHPGFVQGMVEYLQSQGLKGRRITIAEDPRDTDDNRPRHWNGTGFHEVCAATGAKLHTSTTYTCVKKPVENPQTFATLNVSRLAVAPDSELFNVAKLKTHNLAITTLCMKNLMGLVNVFDRHYCLQAWDELPEPVRSNPRPRREWLEREMHEEWQLGLARRLVDTAQVIRPALNVVEGIVGREGTGFQRGRNRVLGLVVAGVNIVAVDSLTSYLMGFDPLSVVYLNLAKQAGLGENDVRKLRVYMKQDGELTDCPESTMLRANPPFRVISGLKGEDVDPFHSAEATKNDVIEAIFSKMTF
jgi:uncharacterized protein (DUF362 family)